MPPRSTDRQLRRAAALLAAPITQSDLIRARLMLASLLARRQTGRALRAIEREITAETAGKASEN